MITKTLKLNASVKVGPFVYVNLVSPPCSPVLTKPVELTRQSGVRFIACPPGKWVNPLGTNKNLTIVGLAK